MHRASRVRLLVLDVDGVLTDGSLYFDDAGLEYKAFHARDGLGMKFMERSDVEVAILTARYSGVVSERMASLGIRHVLQGREQKLPAFEELAASIGLGFDEAAYVGDDVLDLPVMRRVGLAVAVADAHPLVKRHAHWHTRAPGGRGAVREVCELLLQAQGKLEAVLGSYF
jgi:3-deoxy-D-manno-octulosonate 8-phosphate phosphatase (KDO 8-P phosphatase)